MVQAQVRLRDKANTKIIDAGKVNVSFAATRAIGDKTAVLNAISLRSRKIGWQR